MQMNTKNAERYETELDDRETVLTGNVIELPTRTNTLLDLHHTPDYSLSEHKISTSTPLTITQPY
jgi:hypothetical protein